MLLGLRALGVGDLEIDGWRLPGLFEPASKGFWMLGVQGSGLMVSRSRCGLEVC